MGIACRDQANIIFVYHMEITEISLAQLGKEMGSVIQ